MALRMKTILQNKCDSSQKSLLNLSMGQENSDKLFRSQCLAFNKEGLGFNSDDRKT